MDKCSICGENYAVIYASKFEDGQAKYEGICLSCAYEKGYIKMIGMEDVLAQAGITEDNAHEVQARMNEVMAQFGDQDPQAIMQEIYEDTSPAELASMFQDFMKQMSEMNPDGSMNWEDLGEALAERQLSLDDFSATDAEDEAEEDEEDVYDALIDAWLEDDDEEVVSSSQELAQEGAGISNLAMLGGPLASAAPQAAASETSDKEASAEPEDAAEPESDADADDAAEVEPVRAAAEASNPGQDNSGQDDAGDADAAGQEQAESDAPAEPTEPAEPAASEPDDDAADPAEDKPKSREERSLSRSRDRGVSAGSRSRRSRERRSRGRRGQDDDKLRNLRQYATNMNEAARNGEYDRLIGRTEELRRVIQILNRRTKNNPVLLGEPGVGKTAVAEGLAQRIVDEEVPAKLLDMELWQLDMTALVAGTQFRGQFESRMKAVVDEAQEAGNIVLVIDELHNIMGAGDAEGAMNAANILKPSLAKGDIRVLGSTTTEEYRRFIEKDQALERRFQPVTIEEPTPEEAVEILKGNRSRYEEHHFVSYSDAAIEACVELSTRYISERYLPDKAIDIMDESGSLANLNDKRLVSYRRLEKEVERYEQLLERFEDRIPERGQEERFFELQAETRATYLAKQEELDQMKADLTPTPITVDDVAKVVETWTGIPVSRITESESERLMHLEERIHERIVGQDEAVSAVSQAIRRNRAGLRPTNKPSSFIFVGPTGVGKTEMVKAMAQAIFNDEDAYIRLDMSEYMEAHTVSKLIGSPPGYVGYDDGGQLTEKVRRKPYSIILFDEIEKAHTDIFNSLLQILDEGRLTDSHGRVVDFSNTIIVMTSNAGTTSKGYSIGFGSESHAAERERIMNALREIFSPEFLNRVDDIIVFHELSKAEIREISELMLGDLRDGLAHRGIRLQVSDAAKDFLADEGYDREYGARPLRRAITRYVEDPITDLLLLGKLQGVGVIKCDYRPETQTGDKKKLSFDLVPAQKPVEAYANVSASTGVSD